RGDGPGGDRPGRHVLDHPEANRDGSHVGGDHREAVHRRVGEGWDVAGGDDILGEDAPLGFGEGNGLGSQRRDRLEHLGPGLLQRAHQIIPRCRATSSRTGRFSSRASLSLTGRNLDSAPSRGTRTKRISRTIATSLTSLSSWITLWPPTSFSTTK